jgi:phenylpropionate dioxygenase-like ring-hydroxylating dioxygenase large terminal subunit
MRIDADGVVLRSVFVRTFTPVDPGVTRVHWWAARDYAQGDREVDETLRRVHERTMEEDEPLLEAIQATIDQDGAWRPVNAAADAASVRAHQIVQRLVAEERPRS